MTLKTVSEWIVKHGELEQFGRGGSPAPPPPVVPTAPTNVATSALTSSSVTLSWRAPASSGGSPVTGYVVSRDGAGGTSTTLSAATLTQQFRSLSASTTYHVSVAAINAVGTGPAITVTVTTPAGTQPSGGMRFPGDPQPLKNNGNIFFGMSSDDAAGFTSLAQFENQIGRPVGIHHKFDNGIGMPSVAVPDATHPSRLGVLFTTAKADLAAGRLPLGCTHIAASQWQAAGNGTFNAAGVWTPDPAGGLYDDEIYAAVDWCEGSTAGTPNLSGPFFWVISHEPENEGGNPVYYRSWMNRVRWVLDKWEADHATKRKRFTFVTCNMAFTFKASATLGGDSPWWPGDGVPDIAGVDTYAEHSKDPSLIKPTDTVLSSVFKNFVARCKHANMPWGICEYATLPQNTNGAQVIKDVYTYATDGTKDCIFLSYFNSGWWHLTDDNGTLSEARAEAKAAKSIHLSNLGY